MPNEVEKQASSEIAGKSMNKSEIAERAARELLAVAQDTYPLDEKLIGLFQARIERAIAESQAAQPDSDAYGYCEYSAIHRETAHLREPGCVNWRPL